MKALKNIKIGWKKLETILNLLIDAINARSIAVAVGGGLDVQETENGILLALSSAGALAKGTTTGTTTPVTPTGDLSFIQYSPAGQAQWLPINVVVQNGTSYTLSTMYVWGTPPTGYGSGGQILVP